MRIRRYIIMSEKSKQKKEAMKPKKVNVVAAPAAAIPAQKKPVGK